MSARVLVVDDVLPNVKLLAAKLSREYFDVITAHSGPEALERVNEDMPDIVLLDVMMPGMDGFEVCERIRANPATMHIPVVMVTALSDSTDRIRGLEAGADDFLTKPVNDIALFARVRSLVRLKMMIDEWRLREATSGQFGVLPEQRVLVGHESTLNARVLLVEDDPIDVAKITETLARDQAVLTASGQCQSALGQALAEEFDLVILSLTLIEEDGLRLCSQLRSHERTRQVPVLLLADDGDIVRVAKGLEVGANDYLVKPIDRNELLARSRIQIRRKRYQERLRTNYELSLSMALTDSLTGVFNRRYMDAHLPRLTQRNQANQKPLAALMLDIDNFKQVNDTYGHSVGDEVLVQLASRVSQNLRNVDLVARMGGEEFLVVMPDADLQIATSVAERLRRLIADTPFTISVAPGTLPVTASLGVAVFEPGSGPEMLLRRADSALYLAKGSGRNRVVVDGSTQTQHSASSH